MQQSTCIMDKVIRTRLSTNPRLVSILVALMLMLLANGRDWIMAGVFLRTTADTSSLFLVTQMLCLYRPVILYSRLRGEMLPEDITSGMDSLHQLGVDMVTLYGSRGREGDASPGDSYLFMNN